MDSLAACGSKIPQAICQRYLRELRGSSVALSTFPLTTHSTTVGTGQRTSSSGKKLLMIVEKKLQGVAMGEALIGGTRTSLLTPRSIPSLLMGHPPSLSDQLIWCVLAEWQVKENEKLVPNYGLQSGQVTTSRSLPRVYAGDEASFA